MAKEKARDKDGSEIIDLREKTSVYSTNKDPHHVTGEEFKVHPKVAEKLIKKGLATAEKPKEAKKAEEPVK